MTSFFGELKRRNVVKVAVAYAIVGWLLVQVADTFFPALQLPEWTVTFVAGLVILGFPLALILSWAYELTPDGMERTESVPIPESIAKVTGRKLDFVIIALLMLGVGFMFVDNYVLDTARPFTGADIDPASLDVELDEPPSAAVELTAVIAGDEQREVLPNSIAVLPLENISPDPNDAYFAVGIHEEILSQLAKIRALNVIARTSVLGYPDSGKSIPEIARELNVEMVMEGSVRIAGDDLRVTVQLIDGATNTHLWTEVYPGDLSDIFAIQADIAARIAMALEVELLPGEQQRIGQRPTESPAAYTLYLEARSLPSDPLTAEGLLDRAIGIDPEFALAYAHKAYLYASDMRGVGRFARDGGSLVSLARDAANRALEIDPSLGIAHVALGAAHHVSSELAQAQAEFERALELSPNDSLVLAQYSVFKRYIGEYDDAISLSESGVSIDPGNSFVVSQLGFNYLYAGDYGAASTEFMKTIDLAPTDEGAHLGLAMAEIVRGNEAVVLTELQFAEELLDPDFTALRLAQLTFAYSQLGRGLEANRFHGMLMALAEQETVPDAILAMADLGVGEHERALERFENTVRSPSTGDQIALAELKANIYGVPILEERPWRELRSRIGVL